MTNSFFINRIFYGHGTGVYNSGKSREKQVSHEHVDGRNFIQHLQNVIEKLFCLVVVAAFLFYKYFSWTHSDN